MSSMGPGRERLAEATRREAAALDRRHKIWLLAVSLCAILLLITAAVRENFLAPWKTTQRRFAEILRLKAADERGRRLARDFRVEMRQVVLPELGGIDRCVSCHTGFDDPRMTDVPNPYRVHPGRYLEWHEPSRFGCTICHRGQGRALDFRDAKAEDRHWDYPLLTVELSQSACGLCHSAREVADRGGQVYAAGARLFEAKGCRACHKLEGRGGELGPALDNEGLKVRGNLPMAGLRGPHTLPQWLKEHFLDPRAVVPGSRMPTPGLNPRELTALTTFLLSLQRRDLPESYLTPERNLALYTAAHPALMTGEQLYNLFCSTCHDTGRTSRYDKLFGIFVPAVRGETFRREADPAYVAANIRQGRSGSLMPAWGPAAGGLSEDEIGRLTGYLLGRDPRPEEAPRASVPAGPANGASGDSARGGRTFRKNCSGCHGMQGEGAIGPSLNNPVVRQHATAAFLFRTIAGGRRNTAMPAFLVPGGLSERDVGDLVAFLRAGQP